MDRWEMRMRSRVIVMASNLGWTCRNRGVEADSDAAVDWMEDEGIGPATELRSTLIETLATALGVDLGEHGLTELVHAAADRIGELKAGPQQPRPMADAPEDGRDVLLTFTPGPATKFNTDPKSQRRRTLGRWDSSGYGEWQTCQGRFNSNSFESWIPLPEQGGDVNP